MNEESRAVFRTRTAIVRYLREFLDARGFLEVETPMMQADSRRRGGAAVRHASQRARSSTCTCASRRSCT